MNVGKEIKKQMRGTGEKTREKKYAKQ